MDELLRKPLTNDEWLMLGALQGATGGVVVIAIAVVWSLAHGEWAEALWAPLVLICLTFTSLINALLGIPVYRWLVRRAARAAAQHGSHEEGRSAT